MASPENSRGLPKTTFQKATGADAPPQATQENLSDRRCFKKKRRFHVRELPPAKGGKRRWEVSGVLNGKQVRSRFDSLSDANAEAQRLNLLARGGSEFRDAVTTLSDHLLRDAEAAHRILNAKYPNANLCEAVNLYIEKFNPCSSEHTIITALEIYIQAKRLIGRSDRQLENYSYVLRKLSKTVPEKRLHEITREDISHYLDAKPNWAPKSWNIEHGEILGFFNWCKHDHRKWIAENPAQGFDKKACAITEPEILDLATCQRLMAYVDQIGEPAVAFMFALCLFTGIRPDYKSGEFFELGVKVRAGKSDKHFRIDTKQLFLSRDITKDKRNRYIQLQPNLLVWLKKYPPTEQTFEASVIDRHYGEIRKRFAIPHDGLRHTFISALASLRGIEKAAIQAGNSVKMIEDHYFNLISDEDVKAFWEIFPA